ncbi:MAG: zinc-finger domain-containing protein [Burkholderiales bacterium]|nr:MAG: zinc-finger domain-containing protein [Burkholderiales bacterium]
MSAKPKDPKVDPKAPVHVTASDLHGHGVVFCPNPKMPLWSAHPKVYLDVAKTGEASCPYCGTHYVLSGPAPAGH